MMIQPFQAYMYYLAVKLHFNSKSYVAPKFNYKVKANSSSFYKRKDLYHFTKVAKRFRDENELVSFYVAHIVNDDNAWIGKMLDDDATWERWKKYQESLHYNFKQEMSQVAAQYETFDELFLRSPDMPFPVIVACHLKNMVNLEVIVLLNQLTGFMKHVNISDKLIWDDFSHKVSKYSWFVTGDREKLKNIILNLYK